jgi:hypothetical protein
MSKSAVAISYGGSLLWVALFIAIAIGVMNVAELTLIDFVHGNPHRPQSNALFMMAVFTPIFGIIGAIGTFLIFTVPQLFQAALIVTLSQIFGDRARFAALLALPLTAILTWYSYDFLTPTDFNLGINVGPDWVPFKHGLSLSRFMSSLAVQTPVTLFSFLYFDAGPGRLSKKSVLVTSLATAIVVGLIWGYLRAQNQLQFL